jgi:predicted peptidase
MSLAKLLLLAVGCLFAVALAQSGAADQDERGFLNRVFKGADGAEAKYVLFAPHDYKGDKPYPVILFLHGAGETGTDGKKQAAVGLGPAIKKQEKTFPFIAVFPQSQKRTWQADSDDANRALAILAEIEKQYKVDPKRVYLTGLSMGGFGTWSLAAKHPDKWAAIAPICGGAVRAKDDGAAEKLKAVAEKIKHIPCWCFHGDADKAVPVQLSRDIIKALKDAGGSPKYDEYPGVPHNSWDRAYGTAELYDWMLKQQKK